jgi:hypothetical protein
MVGRIKLARAGEALALIWVLTFSRNNVKHLYYAH